MSSINSDSRFLYPSGSRRVVTTPSWARKLGHDDDEDELSDNEPSTGPVPRRPSNPTRRSLSSVVRGTRANSLTGSPLSPGGQTASTAAEANGIGRARELSNGAASGSSSPSRAPLIPTRPEQAHSVIEVQRGPDAGTSPTAGAADKGWWTFTLPSKYLNQMHAAIHPDEFDEKGKRRERDHDGEDEDRRSMRSLRSARSGRSRKSRDLERQNYHRKMTQSMNVHLAPPNVFSINQTQTPGWSTPWTPFHREEDARNFQDPFDLTQNTAAAASKRSKFENFVLQNPFSPLFFRFINLILNGCTLGLAAHIRLQESNAGVIGVVGSSTLFAIVVAPFAIVHIFITLYIEYFGLPIGLWKISTKMFYTLTDLVFICLYSAILSLAFDDLFTSSLECTNWTPYSRYSNPPAQTGTADVEGSLADSICAQQSAQVAFIFASVLFYLAVLIVSLWRIFAKVTSRTRI
ncbi:hypothetical protein JCM10213_007202 [Rhodosporidiobolus nylandii]